MLFPYCCLPLRSGRGCRANLSGRRARVNPISLLRLKAFNREWLLELLRRQFLHIAVLPAVLGMARAETNVSRPLRLIVGFAAGSSVDIIARLMAEQITKAQSLTIVVENQPGAGTVLATEAASRAAPDGNTLLIISPPCVINPHLRKQSYNPLTSFEPICDLLHTPTLIVVNKGSRYLTLSDLLDDAPAKPAALSLASIGPATTPTSRSRCSSTRPTLI